MRAPSWLTARPVAHRGLHDLARGIVENMPGAAEAAIAGSFSIECDVQLTADGEAMVHHDDGLGRLTEGSGALLDKTAAELKAVRFKNTSERMMSLGDLCALVAGRVPLVIEIKSHFDGDRKLVRRMAEVLGSYQGPAAAMSFDPDQVLALRETMPKLPRGIIAQRSYDDDEWKKLTPEQRDGMLHLRHAFHTEPHFVAFWVNQLPAPAPWIARHIFGLPLLTWTVRTPEQRQRAARYADQMIFEGFRPET
ncbi:glycerophosphodiester phosphodiesterase [Bradyrhizobium sp. dw_78]|uniref:glycerophosphodiester phosphodiesterase n=1 Tax=Bradyrhizobium sp. dw_78 TaxID=2719793 RepID=UPI001BD58795